MKGKTVQTFGKLSVLFREVIELRPALPTFLIEMQTCE
ncbi:rCG56959 [Rattus norvegicus]|uniref:RCG56959 n=1 Tax=Rattus norvegicus TaxID=10116 RepID=A6JD22_RAT|nr:rCG56959 [Rattus norvegicus]